MLRHRQVKMGIETLNRLNALRNLGLEQNKRNSEFIQRVARLELKYQTLYQPFYTKRSTILKGDYEPNDEECDYQSSDEDSGSEEEDDVDEKEEEEEVDDGDYKGIPEFWLQVLMNTETVNELIEEHDMDALTYLEDIQLESLDVDKINEKEEDICDHVNNVVRAFKLVFHFAENQFFTNKTLSKTYYLRAGVENGEQFDKSIGEQIKWKPGKALDENAVVKKLRHKSSGKIKQVTRKEPQPTFFDFFIGVQVNLSDDVDEEEAEKYYFNTLKDIELGELFKAKIIPQAIFYFSESLGEPELEYEDFMNMDLAEDDSDDSDYKPDL